MASNWPLMIHTRASSALLVASLAATAAEVKPPGCIEAATGRSGQVEAFCSPLQSVEVCWSLVRIHKGSSRPLKRILSAPFSQLHTNKHKYRRQRVVS